MSKSRNSNEVVTLSFYIAIIDYEMGNLKSISKLFDYLKDPPPSRFWDKTDKFFQLVFEACFQISATFGPVGKIDHPRPSFNIIDR